MLGSPLEAARAAYELGDVENAISISRTGIAEAEFRRDAAEGCLLRVVLSPYLGVKGEYEGALLLIALPDSPDSFDADTAARLLNQRVFVFTQLGKFAEARMAVEQALLFATRSGVDATVGAIEITRATLFLRVRLRIRGGLRPQCTGHCGNGGRGFP